MTQPKGSPSVPHPHQFNTKGPLLFSPKNPSVPHQKPSFLYTLQFHTKNPSVQHNPQSHTTLSSKHPSDKKIPEGCVELRGFWRGTEGCVELMSFRCGTKGFFVLN